MYGVPIWWDERTSSLMGKNKFYDWLVLRVAPFHGFFSIITNSGFPLKLKPIPGREQADGRTRTAEN